MGLRAQQEVHQVRQGGRPGDGRLPSPRRLGHLRHAGAHGAAVFAALSAGGRAGKLRFGRRRSAGGHALHRVPHGAHCRRAAGRHRDGDGGLHAQLRRVHLRADRAAHAHSQSDRERFERHRGRHGDQHSAAQSHRSGQRRHRAGEEPQRGSRRSAEARAGPGLSHRRLPLRQARHSPTPTKPAAAAS